MNNLMIRKDLKVTADDIFKQFVPRSGHPDQD